ncbi:DNA transformation protein [Caulobacter ginsengisoli]|uniref:DNA transformation protein n=1 Tax=Caulobacter ginsengisoli TaxID=400775 RepID=A0ABU0ILL1_9CAUL|nr:TfoX/Sxy family protein [Caulobacter ginsengisoli]MDQ0462910.1 DNA transformation protein [Caulobacter ginsengisoli]
MAVSEAIKGQARELFSDLGEVAIKLMFGGAGLYIDGMMFGLIAGEVVHLKVDDETEAAFIEAGSAPFIFLMRDGRQAPLRYWRLPDVAADDPEEAARWGRLALDAALRAKRPKSKAKARADIGPGPWDG